jgi:hypothetical protein
MTLANDAYSPSDADNQHSFVSLGRMTYSLDLILLVYARGRFALELHYLELSAIWLMVF